MDGASLHGQFRRAAALAATEPPPGLIERRIGRRVVRHIPDRLPGELFQTEIGAGAELDDVHARVQHVDERQEQGAVEPIFVELVGRYICRGHHDDAAFKELRKKPAKDHGVGDVGDVKFVEAQQPSLRGQFLGDESDRVIVGMFAELHFLPDRVNAFVHIEHEFVKMRAALSRHRTALEKQIHQHRLAAPDVAVDIDTFDRRQPPLAAREQPT